MNIKIFIIDIFITYCKYKCRWAHPYSPPSRRQNFYVFLNNFVHFIAYLSFCCCCLLLFVQNERRSLPLTSYSFDTPHSLDCAPIYMEKKRKRKRKKKTKTNKLMNSSILNHKMTEGKWRTKVKKIFFQSAKNRLFVASFSRRKHVQHLSSRIWAVICLIGHLCTMRIARRPRRRGGKSYRADW